MPSSSPRRILGIDPGFGRMGFGVIEGGKDTWKVVTYGCIETSAKDSFVVRLLEIHNTLKKIIEQYHPDRAGVEELFFYKNVKTAVGVGQARGAILLTLTQAGIPIDEFTPLQIKQAMTSYGRAEKGQVQTMVKILLGITENKLQDDAADALAVALTAGVSLGSFVG